MTTIDALVVGGGPVGLATALHLRDAGMHVEVLEPRADPIDKACGEGLMPSAVAELAALGIDTGGAALRGIRYLAGPHRAEARFPGEPGRGIRRLVLQSRMGEAAAARGIPVHPVAAERIRIGPDSVEVDGRRARYLIGADGLRSTVRRAAGLGRPNRGRSRFGLRRHYRLAPWTDLIEVQWARSAEAYVTPVADDEIGVAVLSSTRASFEDHLASFPALRARIADATPTSDVRGSGRLRQDVAAVGQGRVALVGDAAGYIDALTGEGLSIGLATASVLARCLVEDRLDDYPRAWARATRRSRALTHGLLAVSSVPPLRRAIVPVAERVPAVYGAVVRGLSG